MEPSTSRVTSELLARLAERGFYVVGAPPPPNLKDDTQPSFEAGSPRATEPGGPGAR